METLTAILHEMRNEWKRDYDTVVTGGEAAAEPSHRRHRNRKFIYWGDYPKGYIYIEMRFGFWESMEIKRWTNPVAGESWEAIA